MVSDALAGFASGFSRVFLENMKEQGAIKDKQKEYSELIIGTAILPEDTTPEELDAYKLDLMGFPPKILETIYGRRLIHGDSIKIDREYEPGKGTGFKLGSNTLSIITDTTPRAETQDQYKRRVTKEFLANFNSEYQKGGTTQDALRKTLDSLARTPDGLSIRAILIDGGFKSTEYSFRTTLAEKQGFLNRVKSFEIGEAPRFAITENGFKELDRLGFHPGNEDKQRIEGWSELLYNPTGEVQQAFIRNLQAYLIKGKLPDQIEQEGIVSEQVEKESQIVADNSITAIGPVISEEEPSEGVIPPSVLSNLSRYESKVPVGDEYISALTNTIRQLGSGVTASQFIEDQAIKITLKYPQWYEEVSRRLTELYEKERGG